MGLHPRNPAALGRSAATALAGDWSLTNNGGDVYYGLQDVEWVIEDRSCAGFSDACITEPSMCSGGRHRRSAKARNRGQDRFGFCRCELWGFEARARLLSRGRNGERPAIWMVDRGSGSVRSRRWDQVWRGSELVHMCLSGHLVWRVGSRT